MERVDRWATQWTGPATLPPTPEAVVGQMLERAQAAASRRAFLRRSATLGVAGAGLLVGGVACTGGGDGEQAAAEGEGGAAGGEGGAAAQAGGASVLDRILEQGTVRLGADLTFPPLQFRDDDGEPAGYAIELALRMMEDLGVEVEIVEVPFAELFGALASGRFDFSGIAATNLPSRAQQVQFADLPAYIESNVVLVNTDAGITSSDQLNSPDVTLAVLVGSAQEASAMQLFPEAELRSLEQQPAVQDAATGRSQAVLLGEFNVAEVLETNDSLQILDEPPLFADINTFFMPVGDVEMQAYVNNWLSYQTIRGTLAAEWRRFVADPAAELGIPSVPVYSPYLAAAQVLGPQA